MQKYRAILCAMLLASLLCGCTSNSKPTTSDGKVSDVVGTPTTDETSSGTTTIGSTANATAPSDTTTTVVSTTTTTTISDNKTSKSETTKPSSTSKTLSTTKNSKTSTTTTTTSTTSTTTTTTSTTSHVTTVTTTKKNHGTPNIAGIFRVDMANELLTKLNKARKDAGLKPLMMDYGNMMIGAKIRAKEITVLWAHERPDHESWSTVYDEEGIKYNMRGENLAKGYRTADAVLEGWMNSEGHRANMMHKDFTHISIACLEYDGTFYWVQLFGANTRG